MLLHSIVPDVHVSEFICLKTLREKLYMKGRSRKVLHIPHQALIKCSNPRNKAAADIRWEMLASLHREATCNHYHNPDIHGSRTHAAPNQASSADMISEIQQPRTSLQRVPANITSYVKIMETTSLRHE